MASFVFEGMAGAFIFSISAAEILANRFSAILFGKAIVTAQSSLSSNYCLRVTAEGANQNAVGPFSNTEFILNAYSNVEPKARVCISDTTRTRMLYLKTSSSYKLTGEKSLEIDEVYARKIKVKVFVNQQNSVS